MPIVSEVFEKRLPRKVSWEEQAFWFCEFRDIDGAGVHTTSAFNDCTFERCDFYWALFNNATLIGVTFRHCDFRGCGFPGCRFVECMFENCRFVADNLGGDCRFEDSRWYGCKQKDTIGLRESMAPVERKPKKK